MLAFYRFVLYPLLILGANVASILGKTKVRETLRARRSWRKYVPTGHKKRQPTVVVHSASAGEFEQARPVLAALRERYEGLLIVATFGSVSGLRQHVSAREADVVMPLPLDLERECRDFLNTFQPDAVLVMRYDLWPVFARQVTAKHIPLVLVSGTMRPGSLRASRWFDRALGRPYQCLTAALMVAHEDVSVLNALGVTALTLEVGDTRYDRVLARANEKAALPLPPLDTNELVLIAGSTWDRDEEILADLVRRSAQVRLVIVPHEPTEDHLQASERRFPGIVRLSRCGEAWPAGAVLVDALGLLSALYRLGDIAYVGGGFGAGVHSVLEPASYNLPVLCGPRIGRSRDAAALWHEGLLSIVEDGGVLVAAIEALVGSDELRQDVGARTGAFIRHRSGATGRIMDQLDALDVTKRFDTP